MKTIVDNFGSDVDATLDAALNYDPVDQAEKLAENFGLRGNDRNALILKMAIQSGADKRALLEGLGDTTLSNTVVRYKDVLAELGFEEVLAIPFAAPQYGYNEHYYVYAHRDGLLLTFDTYGGENQNGGHLYYNWKIEDRNDKLGCTSSGCFARDAYDRGEYVWVGHHDAREALKRNIRKLRENGQFLTQWIEQPFLWLLHYMDTKNDDYDYKAINAERIAMLPEWVQKMIGTNKG